MIVGSLEIQLMAGIARLQRDMNAGRQVVSNATASMERAANAARSALASIGAGVGLSQIVALSDQYAKFTAQLRLATLSQREYTAAYADVKRIANQSAQGLQETGVLYARIANGTRELGTTQKQVAAITETVNLSLLVSGATASESASAQLQLSQAFAAGALRGEEFNAVNEAAPRLMQALADGIGVPVGALKKMAEEGKITTDVMTRALGDDKLIAILREQGKQIQTIGGAFTVLRNNVMEFVGAQAQTSGAVTVVTRAITGLADSLETLTNIGLAAAAVYGSRMVAAMVTGIKAKMDDIVASRAQAVATQEAAGAALRRAQAERTAAVAALATARERTAQVAAEVAADRQRVASAMAAAEQQIVIRQGQFAATAAIVRQEIALEQTRLAAQINSIGRAQRTAELARLATQLGAIEKGMAAQSAALNAQRIAGEKAVANAATAGAAQIAAARAAETTATGAAAAATLGARTATAGLTTAMGAATIAGRVLSGALALVGGPIGLVTLALTIGVTAWMAWGNRSKEENDKALQSTDETTKEMIARLDQQIAKLQERNRLQGITAANPTIQKLGEINEADLAALQRAKDDMDAAINGTGRFAARSESGRKLAITNLTEEYNLALLRVKQAQDEVAKSKELAFASKYAEWQGKNGTTAQKEAYELEALRKEYGRITPEMEKWVKAKHADKGADRTIKQEATAYQNLITSIRERLASNQLEMNGYERLSESQKMQIKLDQEIATGKNKLTPTHVAEARALIDAVAAQEEVIASQGRAADGAEKMAVLWKGVADAATASILSAEQEATRNEELARTYGMSKLAIEQLELSRLEEQLAQRSSIGMTLDEIEQLEKLIDAKRRNVVAVGNIEGAEAAKQAGADLDKFLDPTRAQTFGEALKGAFGAAGDAMTQLISGLDAYGIRQAEIAKARKDASVKYATDEKGYAAATAAITAKEAKSRLSGYGDMAAAAKGFFKENSTGYRVMEAAERTYRAIELANQMQSLYTHLFVTTAKATGTATGQAVETGAVVAGEATRNAAKVPGVFMSFMSALGPWGMAAAAVAIAAVLGGAFSGGGSSVSLSQQRQDKQGTGTVFGDSSAKSESILNAIETVEDNTYQGLAISQGMLSALNDIKSNIGSFAAQVIRNDSITGTAKKFEGLDGSDSNFLSKLGNSIFGGKKTLEDTGFTMKALSFADVLNGGVDANAYADIKKSGGWFSSSKTSTQLEGLGPDGNRQITNVIASLGEAIKRTAGVVGLEGDELISTLNSYEIDLGKISFKGMKPDEIEAELQAVFSALGDNMAAFAVAGLEPFQQVGEGYLETLTRVAASYETVDVVMESLGMDFNAVGLASVGARQRLIDLAGGLDEFTAGAEQFLNDFYTDQERADSLRARLVPTLDQFGIKTGAEDSLQQFRSVVTGLDLTTEAGARAYATLIQIAPAFKQIADVDAAIFEERAELQDELDQLTMSAAQLLAKQRDALDESNRALFDQIQAIKAQTDAAQAAKDTAASLMGGVDAAFSVLQRVVDREKRALQDQIDVRTKAIQSIQSLSQALRGALDGMSPKGFEAEDRRAAQVEIQRALAIAKASGVLPNADDLKRALSVLGKDAASQFTNREDYLRDFYATRNGIEDLAGLTDDALSVEERSLKRLEDQVKQFDLMLEREQEQINILKGISDIGLSIEQAILALRGAMQAASSNPVNSATSAISDAYKSSLGRAPDAAGLDYWQDRAAGGISTGAIVDSIKNSPEAQIQKLYQDVFGRSADAAGLSYWTDRLAGGIDLNAIKQTFLNSDEKKGRIPGFMEGGDHVGGWRIVGENGPELEATGPSRIFNAGQTRDLMSRLTSPADNSSALAAAVDRLNATVDRQAAVIARQGAALEQIQRNTRRQADTMDIVTEGGKAMRTKEQQVSA